MQDLLQPILNAVLLGGLYGVIAIGLSTIVGIVKVINFAHGDLMVLSSYMSLVLALWLGANPFLTFFAVIPVMYLVGFFIQGYLINRVLGKDLEPPLIVTFGLSIILQNLFLLIFTPDARTLTTDLNIKKISLATHLYIPANYLFDFLVGIGVIACLYFFFQKTYLGRAIRAASDDESAAQLMGVNTKRIYAHAMGISMMTAAVAGILVGMTFTFYPHTGSQFMFVAFGVAIIGGMGSMKGTLLAGIILAMGQLLGTHFFGPGYQIFAGHILLLIVLLVRPEGIFGRL
jgi:branched-chain amino acid transport system permease protein